MCQTCVHYDGNQFELNRVFYKDWNMKRLIYINGSVVEEVIESSINSGSSSSRNIMLLIIYNSRCTSLS